MAHYWETIRFEDLEIPIQKKILKIFGHDTPKTEFIEAYMLWFRKEMELHHCRLAVKNLFKSLEKWRYCFSQEEYEKAKEIVKRYYPNIKVEIYDAS